MKESVKFESERLGYGNVTLSNPSRLAIPEGICAVVGSNGSGKSTLGLILAKGRHAYGNRLSFRFEGMTAKMLTFTDIHSFTGVDVLSHEQRLESTANDFVPTVAEIVGQPSENPEWQRLCTAFGLREITGKRINYLSSGELRKLLVVNALYSRPDILVLDNPYIGLDSASRQELDSALEKFKSEGIGIVMLICDNADIPAYADSVLILENRILKRLATSHDEIETLRATRTKHTSESPSQYLLPSHPTARKEFDTAFAINSGHLRYGDREVIANIDWEVRHGERWVLTGPNGSGKSLLLSMICGDHPQAYANDITLFDRRRGSGESIWDIKDRIGYICPEMQLYFRSAETVADIVARGLRSMLNRFAKITDEEHTVSLQWLEILGISHLADRKFETLSSGEQRMTLLARTFIKQPDLLILDEPLHGLDSESKKRVRNVIDTLTIRNGSSLIFVSHYQDEIPSCVTQTKRLFKN